MTLLKDRNRLFDSMAAVQSVVRSQCFANNQIIVPSLRSSPFELFTFICLEKNMIHIIPMPAGIYPQAILQN